MLILTTTQALWIIDPDRAQAWLIDTGKGVYYGVTIYQGELFVAARQATYGSDREPQNNIILRYDSELRLREILRPLVHPIRDVHQIATWDGVLYVTSTFDDLLFEFDIGSGQWSQWSPFDLDEPGLGKNRHHINSVQLTDDRITLAGLKPQGWAASFDRISRSLIEKIDLGDGTHNVWWSNGIDSVCSSNEGAIATSDGRSVCVHDDAWLRGYCESRGRRFVGGSQTRMRSDRAFSDCVIFEIDRDSCVTRSLIIDGAGMLHDLRALDSPDRIAHNGEIFPVDVETLNKRFVKRELMTDLTRFTSPGDHRSTIHDRIRRFFLGAPRAR